MGLWDFFTPEAGQKRRKWLDETVGGAAQYYLGGTGLDEKLAAVAELNPILGMERAGTSAKGIVAPGASGWDRVKAVGDTASSMAGVMAPMGAAKGAGKTAAAITEMLTGASMGPRAVAGDFAASEAGALKLYHGSPHNFDKFSMDKIGTGEGAQAYGHGLYFAENEGVAKGYRDALSLDSGFNYKGKNGLTRDQVNEAITAEYGGKYLDNITTPRGVSDGVMDEIIYGPTSRDFGPQRRDLRAKLFADIQKTDPGSMYEVNVNANSEDFLDWDAPLSAQPQKVRNALSKTKVDSLNAPDVTSPYDVLNDLAKGKFNGSGDAAMASTALREAGIPGIRYKDAGSRGADGSNGTSNYVVFDGSLISILRKYGLAGAAVGATQMQGQDPKRAEIQKMIRGGT